MAETQRTPEDCFWDSVQKSDGCWLWTGERDANGYGLTSKGKYADRAHRLSYILSHGEITDGLWVLHRCDNPPCVRPDHLWLGTAKDNTADMIKKGRKAILRGENHWSRSHPESVRRGERHPHWGGCPLVRGELHGMAKLTLASVEEMRARYRQGGCTLKGLAAEYGVNPENVSLIVRCRIWKVGVQYALGPSATPRRSL